MTNIEYINDKLREAVLARKEIESKVAIFNKGYESYKAKQSLRKIVGEILVLKYYYYIEENKDRLSLQSKNVFVNIGTLINDRDSFISELMKLEFDYYDFKKEEFLKFLINNVIFNIEQQILYTADVSNIKNHVENKIINYPNSDDSKNKIQTIINYLNNNNIKDQKTIQNIIVFTICQKHKFYYSFDGKDYTLHANEILKILQKNNYKPSPINAQILRFEILYNLLNYLRLIC